MIDWKHEARINGFATPKGMFNALYHIRRLSTSGMSQLLGLSRATIINGMRKYQVVLRRRGGKRR